MMKEKNWHVVRGHQD